MLSVNNKHAWFALFNIGFENTAECPTSKDALQLA